MKNILILITIILCFFAGKEYLFANELEVPVINQIQFLKKILSVEKKLLASKDKEIKIGIIYQSDNKVSKKTAEDFKTAINGTPLKAGDKTFNFFLIDIKNAKDVINILENNTTNIDALVITQMRNIDYKLISNYSVDNSILTFATSEKVLLNNRFSLGVGYKGNNVQLLFNPKQIAAEGYNFPALVFERAKKVE